MRVANWPEILDSYLKDHKALEFKWGSLDCCTFTCDFIKEITGVDPMQNHRGQYDDLKSSLKARTEFGTIDESMSLHFDSIPVSMAGRGDAVIYEIDGYDALGICSGLHSNFMGPDGAITVPTLNCKSAWRIV